MTQSCQSLWRHRDSAMSIRQQNRLPCQRLSHTTKCEWVWCHSHLWPRCRTSLYAHIWRSLMSSILSPYLGMPIYGHIVVINPYDRLSLTRTIDSSIYGARAFNRSGQIMGFHSQVWPRCRTPLYAHIWRSLMSSLLSPYLGFMPIYGDPSCHQY